MNLRSYQINAINETFNALLKNDDPVLFDMSVGGGKSICIGTIVKKFEDKNKRVLCLVNNTELVRNNSKAFNILGGKPSIFCASIGEKDISNNIIFATPQSIISAIKRNHPISVIIFSMIVVDEAHGINYLNDKTVFMRILRHYKQRYPSMRLLGLTGTPFRMHKTEPMSIVGDNALFKTKTANITTSYLIENEFLVKPSFGHCEVEGFDFSKCKIKNNGEFRLSDLNRVIDSKQRLTYEIMQEVKETMTQRNGAFIFCSTVEHCTEAYSSLPWDESAIITGDTPEHLRNKILNDARNGLIKYLISVNCLMVGVDVPLFDTIVWIRPTSSLLLFIQGIGRGLRLHKNKEDCLVLDYAGNIDRFSDFDDPIINDAIKPKPEEERDYVIQCFDCNTMNTLFSRRCIGVHNKKRCEHYFEWKDCPACETQNDQCARYCRNEECKKELIDPNKKLSHPQLSSVTFDVVKADYWVSMKMKDKIIPIIHIKYYTGRMAIFEDFYITDKSKNVVYGKFVKQHISNPSLHYPNLQNINYVKSMLKDNQVKTPNQIICILDDKKRYKIVKKIFNSID